MLVHPAYDGADFGGADVEGGYDFVFVHMLICL
jgi:hypothetical protein